MRPISVVVAAVGVVLVGGIVWVLGPGTRWVLEHVDQVAIGGPTGLDGRELAAAQDAVRGRVLAVVTGLAALFYTARNADTARRTFQLGERGHVTDRYGKAVEQFGSAQAPVRLGGLHALEQLAQDNPDPDLAVCTLAPAIRSCDRCGGGGRVRGGIGRRVDGQPDEAAAQGERLWRVGEEGSGEGFHRAASPASAGSARASSTGGSLIAPAVAHA
ncbi:hypothetical protein [Nonomuraea sp. NPDC049709]|uniref:hypothetical protein n=1 Tax=Nonomuraea sp. NPDC049709 TaxID=3154736 RepID=UPI0034387D28